MASRLGSALAVMGLGSIASALHHAPEAPFTRQALAGEKLLRQNAGAALTTRDTELDVDCFTCRVLGTAARIVDGVFMSMASRFTLSAVAIMCRTMCDHFQDTEITGLEQFHNVMEQARRDGRVVITYANHRSTLDDPVLPSIISKWSWLVHNTKFLRWGVCADNVCFSINSAVDAFFGAGKVMPIERGAGIGQPGMRCLESKLSQGSWVHIFPEGRCKQSEDGYSIKRFKWGVGRLVATAQAMGLDPIVIPIAIHGMEKVMPQDPDTDELLHPGQPILHQQLSFHIGEPLDLSHLRALRSVRPLTDKEHSLMQSKQAECMFKSNTAANENGKLRIQRLEDASRPTEDDIQRLIPITAVPQAMEQTISSPSTWPDWCGPFGKCDKPTCEHEACRRIWFTAKELGLYADITDELHARLSELSKERYLTSRHRGNFRN